ncbi:hypothetical protein NY78_1751 [Desulfovibrio sp. TomC]|nr:hypothetical protein NY78_1751 [Desulfovibrio sp. TomC]
MRYAGIVALAFLTGLTFAEPGDPDGFLVKWMGWERDRDKAMG